MHCKREWERIVKIPLETKKNNPFNRFEPPILISTLENFQQLDREMKRNPVRRTHNSHQRTFKNNVKWQSLCKKENIKNSKVPQERKTKIIIINGKNPFQKEKGNWLVLIYDLLKYSSDAWKKKQRTPNKCLKKKRERAYFKRTVWARKVLQSQISRSFSNKNIQLLENWKLCEPHPERTSTQKNRINFYLAIRLLSGGKRTVFFVTFSYWNGTIRPFWASVYLHYKVHNI